MWAAVAFGRQIRPTEPGQVPNAGALFGKFCLTRRNVNEFVTLAVIHAGGHAGS
jgi:hypothetical protein